MHINSMSKSKIISTVQYWYTRNFINGTLKWSFPFQNVIVINQILQKFKAQSFLITKSIKLNQYKYYILNINYFTTIHLFYFKITLKYFIASPPQSSYMQYNILKVQSAQLHLEQKFKPNEKRFKSQNHLFNF